MDGKLKGLLLIAAILIGGYWLYARGDESWRQKMIVTVSTPTGDVSGEAVTSVYVHKNDLFKDGAAYQFTLKGEAVVVDLGAGKYLFALLSTANDYEYVAMLLPHYLREVRGVPRADLLNSVVNMKDQIALPDNLYPMLVTFSDINEPRSVKEVTSSNIAGTFGSGYSLKSITLEIADESVTTGRVESLLPWLWTLRTGLIPTKMKNADDYLPIETVGPNHFIMPYQPKGN